MVYLTSERPDLTNIRISWSEVLELPVRRRNQLVKKLDDIRSKEVDAIRAARR